MRIATLGFVLYLSGCGSSTGFSPAVADQSLAGAADATLGTTAPKLSTLTVSPAKPTLALGENLQFRAIGHFSDGSSQDLTNTATWGVGDATVVSLANGAGSFGLAHAVKPGGTTVVVSSGTISGSTDVTITAATLVSIAVQPATTSNGKATPLTVIGTYSDGTTANVTGQAVLTVAKPQTGSFGTAPGATSVLTPTVDGTIPVTATVGGVSGGGTVTVTATALACSSTTAIIHSTQTTVLTWSGPGKATYTVAAASATPPAEIGTVAASGSTGLQATYTAPATAAGDFDVDVTATAPDGGSAACEVRIAADGALGVPDDGKTPGLVGNVYPIPGAEQVNSTTFMMAWLTESPIASILMPTLNVPNTPYQAGFPGYPSLTAWFAIDFTGRIDIPTPGAYTFQVEADDGAVVYIDGQAVVNDDGVHAITTATGTAVQLTAGLHTLEVRYFQGPPIYLAITLLWQGPNDHAFSIVPTANILRPVEK